MPEAVSERTVIIKHPALKVLDGGFTQIPTKVLRNADLSTGARLAYALLLSYAWQEDFCFPAQDKLAKDLGMTDRHIRRHLTELREKGYITWKQRGLNRPNIYYILEIDPAKPTPPPSDEENAAKHADRTSMSAPERTSASDQDRTPVSAQERTLVSDYKDSQKNTQSNVNVAHKSPSGTDARKRAAAVISETALKNHYGFTDRQIDETQRLVHLQIDVLGAGDRNHAAYVQRAAEAVHDGISNVLQSALAEVKDTSHRKAIASLPAYFTRVYDAVRDDATRPQLEFPAPHDRHPQDNAEDDARTRLIADAERRGVTIPDYIRAADIRAVNQWWAALAAEPERRT